MAEDSTSPDGAENRRSARGRTAVAVVGVVAFVLGLGAGWLLRGRAEGAESEREAPQLPPPWLEAVATEPPAELERPELLPYVASPKQQLGVGGRSMGSMVEDAWVYFRRPDNARSRSQWHEHPDGGFVRHTGPLGLRLTGPLPDERPEPLIVLTGDSHMDGVCADDETAAAVLEARLAAEPATAGARVLNAGVGQYTFPHYLAVAWRYLQLKPEAFVVVVFGGNDFGALDSVEADLRGEDSPERPAGYAERLQAAGELEVASRSGRPTLWQVLNQVSLFSVRPELVDWSVERSFLYLDEIQRLADEAGTRFIVVYLPPLHDVFRSVAQRHYPPLLEALELQNRDLLVTDQLADALLAGLDERGIESLDLRPPFRYQSSEPLYWIADEHVNHRGLALLGDLLAERLAGPTPPAGGAVAVPPGADPGTPSDG